MGFFSWTLIYFRSHFLYYLLIDLLRVFLGVSSSVLTLEALIGSSKSGKEMSFSICFRKALCQVLLLMISLTSLKTSDCLLLIWVMNFLKPGLLFLGLKLNKGSVISAT